VTRTPVVREKRSAGILPLSRSKAFVRGRRLLLSPPRPVSAPRRRPATQKDTLVVDLDPSAPALYMLGALVDASFDPREFQGWDEFVGTSAKIKWERDCQKFNEHPSVREMGGGFKSVARTLLSANAWGRSKTSCDSGLTGPQLGIPAAPGCGCHLWR
jgi:hypothetical protein